MQKGELFYSFYTSGVLYMLFLFSLLESCLFFYVIGDCSVTDIKGGEWDKLLQFVQGTIISMDGANARFVNTLRLDDLECTLDDCEEAFNMAVRLPIL